MSVDVANPVFSMQDWWLVWLWPTLMSGLVIGASGSADGSKSRFVKQWVVFASLWIPAHIVGKALDRGSELAGGPAFSLLNVFIGVAAGFVVLGCLNLVPVIRRWLDWPGSRRISGAQT